MIKRHLKLNILSLFCISLSFISITLAWFAYSGLATSNTEVDVKAWYIEFEKDNNKIQNEIVLDVDEISPGMQTVKDEVTVKNLGDTNANISYQIKSVRILDQEIEINNENRELIEDELSHDYPFHINISLNKNFVKSKDDISKFALSISWPLDSNNNELDSKWGNDAFKFYQDELNKKNANNNYEIRSSVEIVIELKAEQYIEENSASDLNFNRGKIVLYDVIKNESCNAISDSCLKTYVLDVNNKVDDLEVNLLPDLFGTYQSGTYNEFEDKFNEISNSWNVTTRPLSINDILKIISKDILNSYIIRENLSDEIIGSLKNNSRINDEINKVTSSNGYFKYNNLNFPYLSSSKCYFIDNEYNQDKVFALIKINDNESKIYGEEKINTCSIVPIIVAPKDNIKL